MTQLRMGAGAATIAPADPRDLSVAGDENPCPGAVGATPMARSRRLEPRARSCYHRGMLRSLLVIALAARVAHADEPKYICHEPAADSKITAEFKHEISIAELATWMIGITCKPVVFDSGVAQHLVKVDILSPKPMTPKQAVQLFIDAVGSTGLVVDVKPDTIVIKRNPKMPQGCPDVVTTDPAPVSPAKPDPIADELDAEMEKGIVVVDDTHRTITKALLDKVLANPMAVAKGARVVPAVKDGKPDGFKLYAIRPSSIWARLGLANGDTLHAINGFDLTSADKALEVYTKVRDATALQVDVIRRGKALSLYIKVK
jgi:hypothetical protein